MSGIPVAQYEIKQTDYPYIVYQELNDALLFASGKPYARSVEIGIELHSKAKNPINKLMKTLNKNDLFPVVRTVYLEDNKSTIDQMEVTIIESLGGIDHESD